MFLTNSLLRQVRLLGRRHFRLCWSSTNYSTKPTSNETPDLEKPIAYTQSPANKWKAEYSRQGTSQDRLWYEPYVVLASVAVFLVYFCILREESDVDHEFEISLYSRVKGLEEQQLLIAMKNRQAQGLDNTIYEQRLKELRSKP
ncbi:hypothetical protein RN001_013055 [Aquatica leii]|uniref:Uncharacterized protein n=1 Tax=Aquatica leii TaxID=1421715 RepID=A0AAN7PZK7_9COLE|nr:hypothetical protein RN001_013055 [Aquatica leii]